MNINENLLHQIAAKFIKDEDIQVEIKGTALQIKTLENLLNTSRNLMTEVCKKDYDIDLVIDMIHEKKELTKKFQNITGIAWKL
jgi:hypothetical protein